MMTATLTRFAQILLIVYHYQTELLISEADGIVQSMLDNNTGQEMNLRSLINCENQCTDDHMQQIQFGNSKWNRTNTKQTMDRGITVQ